MSMVPPSRFFFSLQGLVAVSLGITILSSCGSWQTSAQTVNSTNSNSLLAVGRDYDDEDIEGYHDLTFRCPATTVCPQVCVASAEECPQELKCEAPEVLCADGSCSAFCDNTELVSPCADNACAPVACRKIIATYDVCITNYTSYYERASDCSVTESTIMDDDESSLSMMTEGSSGPTFAWTDPAYLAVYAWILSVTVGIIAWCWYK